jgi:hypothetical protein
LAKKQKIKLAILQSIKIAITFVDIGFWQTHKRKKVDDNVYHQPF